MKWRYKLIALAAALFGVVALGSAAPIIGELNIAGSTVVDAFTIDWVPPEPGPETGYGTFTTKLPGTGYFANIVGPPLAPIGGQQRDVTRNPALSGAAPLPALALVGVPIFVPGYLTGFTSPQYAGLEFDLTLILQSPAGVCPPGGIAEGLSCRPDANSPFTLSQLEEGTAIAFEVRGFFEDSAIADSRMEYRGRYSTQVGESVAQILASIAGGGSIDASFSGNFEAIPEPGTVGLALSGLALILVGVIRRRRA
jgi:hypothetical protein